MELQQRVERLERENRRLKLVALGVLAAIGLGVLWQWGVGQPQPAYAQDKKRNVVISDDDIVIKDKAGKDRIRLGIDSNNRAFLQLRGKEITPSFGISIDEKGLGDLTFFGKDGNEQISIRTTQDGKPDIAFRTGTVNFYDSKIGLFTSNINALPGSAFQLTEGDGKTRASLTFDDKTGPSLRMYHSGGKRMISLGDEPVGSFLTVFDQNDRRTVSLGTNNKTGTFMLLDNQAPNGKTLVEVERSDDRARIRFVDKAGKQVILP
ncbi:MAG TPA: hypothetical protein VGN12_19060 [Pirellulales bacterium]|jgi:hypothetical protein